MKEDLRKQIIGILYEYSIGSKNASVERVMSDVWNINEFKNTIRNVRSNDLNGTAATTVLIQQFCLLGINNLVSIEISASNGTTSFTKDRNYYQEGLILLKYAATMQKDLLFFDWYENKILYPMSFEFNEGLTLYENIERCCFRLCREIKGLQIPAIISKMDSLLNDAKNGDITAQIQSGFCYLQGNNEFTESEAEAFKWFKAAAGQNDPMGLCMVGEMYQYGYGVQRDYDTAAMWYKKSADFNFGRAEFRLGWLYANSNERNYFGNNYVTYSPELAAQYYKRAWQHGYEDSMGIVRNFIETGRL